MGEAPFSSGNQPEEDTARINLIQLLQLFNLETKDDKTYFPSQSIIVIDLQQKKKERKKSVKVNEISRIMSNEVLRSPRSRNIPLLLGREVNKL